MIYLASPYTAPTAEGREENFRLAQRATALLIKKGLAVYSPIVHCHDMAERFSFPTDYLFWLKYNNSFIRRAESMFVLKIPGWEKSKGVETEIDLANRAFIPLFGVIFVGEENVLVGSLRT